MAGWFTPRNPDCWLLNVVEVRPSAIAGDGLFTRAAIAAGTFVPRHGGRLVAEAELRTMLNSAQQQPGRPSTPLR